jgi:hypothetical protein
MQHVLSSLSSASPAGHSHAEEGDGKVILLEQGAFVDIDAVHSENPR